MDSLPWPITKTSARIMRCRRPARLPPCPPPRRPPCGRPLAPRGALHVGLFRLLCLPRRRPARLPPCPPSRRRPSGHPICPARRSSRRAFSKSPHRAIPGPMPSKARYIKRPLPVRILPSSFLSQNNLLPRSPNPSSPPRSSHLAPLACPLDNASMGHGKQWSNQENRLLALAWVMP